MSWVGAVQSILVLAGAALGFAALTLAPRWAQVVVVCAGLVCAGALVAHAVVQLDAGVLLGGLILLALFRGLDRVLLALRAPANSERVG